MDSRFEKLLEKIAEDKVLLICGPEVSASSKGMPEWSSLVHEILGKLETPSESHDLPVISIAAQGYVYQELLEEGQGKPGDKVIDEEVVQKRRKIIARYIAEYLDDPTIAPSEIHQSITRLPIRHIVTTNWDNLLEAAFEQQGKPYHKVVRDVDMAYRQDAATLLIKLYGSVEQFESLTLTLNDIQKLPERIPSVLKFMNHASTFKTLLFLGFATADYEFTQLYDILVGSTTLLKPQVFVVQQETFKQIDYWKRRDVEFIDETLSGFLEKTCDALGLSCSSPPLAQSVTQGSQRTGWIDAMIKFPDVTIDSPQAEPRDSINLKVLNERGAGWPFSRRPKFTRGDSLLEKNESRQLKAELRRLKDLRSIPKGGL